jgi:hypothetical protein
MKPKFIGVVLVSSITRSSTMLPLQDSVSVSDS